MQMHKCLKWLTHVTKLYANDGQTELTRIWDKRRLTEEAVCAPECVCNWVTKCRTIKPKRKASKAKQRQRQLTKQNAIMKSYSLLCLISFELYVVRKLRSLSVYLPLLSHYKTLSLSHSLSLSLLIWLSIQSDVQSTEGIPCWLYVCACARALSHSLCSLSFTLACGYLSLKL